ncbi:4Fe-4S ferredoxin [Iocasia frigidifontis]|uniref:Ferredoxin-like protein n=1 Tax=Iocasia fonsfrigidae TaxID=2682810 RepID=A0A8A7K5A0_9FIRM|nr:MULTISPECIES: 4Fe-4S dicluster domain-containing protein [Halanaerobiaceae]AZO93612.1 4Fe-4S ferredoxin [Halocella sp. SP3-1]MTI61868.1 4Fe-4S ferredoxin [Bacillota bacterium]QTL96481.1 4Fe-4S ferredoxin [Iocasia fonsfrigidae]
MGNFIKDNDNPLKYTTIKIAKQSHIHIKEKDPCLSNCENKPCTYYCPTRVFSWSNKEIKVDYKRCIECGACPWGCPYDNIKWSFPPGGYGVNYEI